MNVLADWHHGGLYYSLHLLFEKRLGWKLYRPTGVEWHSNGFWKYSDNPGVVKQYLEPSADVAGLQVGEQTPLGERPADGIYEMPWHEGENKFTMRAVTLEAFKKMDWRFVVASVWNHEEPFARLIREHAPRAVLIRQMGNVYDHFEPSISKNVLNSTMMPVPETTNTVRYHQEFDLGVYRPEKPPNNTTIKSFLHAFPSLEPPQLVSDYRLWHAMRAAMPDYTFKEYGVLCEDGNLPSAQMPAAIRSASFVCHLKFWGDGFGHTIFNSAACGKPIITKGNYFRGMMAGQLLEDEVTFLAIGDDVEANARKIRQWSAPDRYESLSRNMHERFRQVCDFDREFLAIKDFLERAR